MDVWEKSTPGRESVKYKGADMALGFPVFRRAQCGWSRVSRRW